MFTYNYRLDQNNNIILRQQKAEYKKVQLYYWDKSARND